MRRTLGFLNARMLLIVGVAVIGLLWVAFDRESTYNFDAHNKLYQVDSLVRQGFRSEALLYPGADLDPEWRFSPLAYTVELKDGRRVSAFPVALSVLAAPLYQVFGAGALSAIGLVSLIGVWLLYARTGPPPPLLAALMGGTFLWLLVFDFSEYLLAAFLGAASMHLLVGVLPTADAEREALSLSGREVRDSRFVVLRALGAGVLAGMTVWFRHEGLVYGAAILAALVLALLAPRSGGWSGSRADRSSSGHTLMRIAVPFAVGFALPIVAWAGWNIVDYGHVLGPRFLVNRHGFLPSVTEILRRYQNLLFAGGAKLGLFALLPFLPVLLVRSLRRIFRDGSTGACERLLAVSTGIYVFVIPGIVPNDGIAGLGPRFLILAVVPAFLLLQISYAGASRIMRRLLLMSLILVAAFPVLLFSLYRKGAVYQRAMHDRYALEDVEIRVFPTQSLYYYFGADTVHCECYLATGDAELGELLQRLRHRRPGRRVAFVHLRERLHLSDNFISGASPRLRAEAARLVAASRWSTNMLAESIALTRQERAEFKDVEIWTARVVGEDRR